MKLSDLVDDRSIPQWSRCYYDYQGAKIFIKHANKAMIIQEKLRDLKFTQNRIILNSQSQQRLNKDDKLEIINLKFSIQNQLIQSVKKGNQMFFKYHLLNKTVVFLFSQMKLHQLYQRLDRYQNWIFRVKDHKQQFTFLLNHVYSQGKMLYRMAEVNLMAYKQIKIRHIKAFQNFNVQCPFLGNKRITRTIDQLQKYFIRLQNLFMIANQPLPKRLRSQYYQQVAPNPLYESISSYIFGLTNGISGSLIVLSIIIYGTSSLDNYDPQFVSDFPVWRAIAYIIVHMWAFALNTIIFEKFKINYSLVFWGQKMKKQSYFALYIASFFTFEYMVLFVIYLLDLKSLINIQSQITYYFPVIIWGTILGCIILPLPILQWKGRLQFFKQLLMTLISPLFPIHFNVIFMTQQLISHILPISDIMYTFCYYKRQTMLVNNTQVCQSYLHSAQYFGIIIFSYRIIQSLKVAYQNQKLIGTRQIYIAIRGSLNIFLLIISILSTLQNKLVIVWIVFAVPICIYNYYVDVKWDWGLLQVNSKNKLLRDYIVFDKYIYYFIMILNVPFRVISVLAISQNIIYQTDIHPLYLIFSVALIQIIRRLFWNNMKVQRQHVLNCQKFRVKKYYHQNQQQIIKQLQQKQTFINVNKSDLELIKQRKKQQIANLNQFIERKKIMKKQIQQWKQQQDKLIIKFEQKIEEVYQQQKNKKNKKKY